MLVWLLPITIQTSEYAQKMPQLSKNNKNDQYWPTLMKINQIIRIEEKLITTKIDQKSQSMTKTDQKAKNDLNEIHTTKASETTIWQKMTKFG